MANSPASAGFPSEMAAHWGGLSVFRLVGLFALEYREGFDRLTFPKAGSALL